MGLKNGKTVGGDFGGSGMSGREGKGRGKKEESVSGDNGEGLSMMSREIEDEEEEKDATFNMDKRESIHSKVSKMQYPPFFSSSLISTIRSWYPNPTDGILTLTSLISSTPIPPPNSILFAKINTPAPLNLSSPNKPLNSSLHMVIRSRSEESMTQTRQSVDSK